MATSYGLLEVFLAARPEALGIFMESRLEMNGVQKEKSWSRARERKSEEIKEPGSLPCSQSWDGDTRMGWNAWKS